MAAPEKPLVPFAFLTKEQFAALTTKEKLEYLSRAVIELGRRYGTFSRKEPPPK